MTIDTSTEAVEALLKGLPPEPWVENWNRVFDAEEVMVCMASGVRDAKGICYFIAASRELVPALLAERDALKLRAEQAEMREESLKSTSEEARQFLYQRDALKAALADASKKALREAAQRLALHLEVMDAIGQGWPVRTCDKVEAILALIGKGESQ